ncbi:MAG: ABC transporter ATP-binding protein [Acidimicrobiales bacterium]
MLEVADLNAYYGSSHVLHGVGLRVGSGELVALLGRNGAGKTTTFLAMMGLVRSGPGSVRLAGEELTRVPTYRRARRGLALVPSGARVFGNLSVQENLEIVRPRPHGNGTERWSVGRVFEAFPKLATLRRNVAGYLSGGERQMLAVGRALMANPMALLLDEPSEGLAPVVVQQIGQLLDRLKTAGVTAVLAEQNHRFALRHADRAYLIEKGVVRHEAPAAALAGSEELHRYLGV